MMDSMLTNLPDFIPRASCKKFYYKVPEGTPEPLAELVSLNLSVAVSVSSTGARDTSMINLQHGEGVLHWGRAWFAPSPPCYKLREHKNIGRYGRQATCPAHHGCSKGGLVECVGRFGWQSLVTRHRPAVPNVVNGVLAQRVNFMHCIFSGRSVSWGDGAHR